MNLLKQLQFKDIIYSSSKGDLLREEIKKKTELGIKISTNMKEGKFVTDDIVNSLLKKIISDEKQLAELEWQDEKDNLNKEVALEDIDKAKQQRYGDDIPDDFEALIVTFGSAQDD